MYDVTKLSDIRTEMYVKIKTRENEIIEGKIHTVVSKNDDPNGILVFLENGQRGNILEIINSKEKIKERILSETQNSENKLNYYEEVMSQDVIPKTIQSFLNAVGGYLYIGIDDDAPAGEKIVGLDIDRHEKESKEGKLSDDKFKDLLRSDIEKMLDRLLSCNSSLGPLLSFDFLIIDGKMILEIDIKRSPEPVFYKHISRNNKEIEFGIFINDKRFTGRRLDDFWHRDGSRKKLCETNEEFYDYLRRQF